LNRRRVGPVLLLGVLALLAILVAGPRHGKGPPLDPDSTGPDGLRGLVLLLRDRGAHVNVTGSISSRETTALLADDQMGDAQRDDVRDWVRAGGTLLVADPNSPLAGVAGFRQWGGGPLARQCDLPVFRETERIESPQGIMFDTDSPGLSACFTDQNRAFVVARSEGSGTVVALGSPAPLVNSHLGRLDNSVLAVSVLAPRPGTAVAVLKRSPVGGGRTSVRDLISPRLKLGFLELLIAFLVVCLWRARRLGRPVLEPQPVELAGSELVAAVGNLLQQAHRRGQAAQLLQGELRRTLASRLSLARDTPPEVVAEVAAARTGIDKARILAALTAPAPADEGALVALAQETEAVRQEVVHAR
jgi:hypothetical protein